MSRRAWSYLGSIWLVGIALTGYALHNGPIFFEWPTFPVFVVLATVAQLVKVKAPSYQSYHVTLVFLMAGVFLLPPFLFALLVIIPHLIEWAKERWRDSMRLRRWYLQPFNIAVHIIAGNLVYLLYAALRQGMDPLAAPISVFAITASATFYVLVNHGLVGGALVLARGVSIRESGIMDVENLARDFVMLLFGSVVAVLWKSNPWLIVPALSPLLMMHQALKIPMLRKEALTDSKTGLWNARHFAQLFTSEMKRSIRFNRPLALIMADLDLLRNINNTYGHLAGDAVLEGIGKIIKATIREYDIAGRFGGEEFCIVLPELLPGEATAIAERLREAVANTEFKVETSSAIVRATLSIGVATFPRDASSPNDLIHQADLAVYVAKLRGRNCIESAFEIPASVKLERPPLSDRLAEPYTSTFAQRTHRA